VKQRDSRRVDYEEGERGKGVCRETTVKSLRLKREETGGLSPKQKRNTDKKGKGKCKY